MPKLTSIKKKLASNPISALTAEELKVYFDYRLQNLLKDKRVLTRRELEYLMGETGPGTIRIDPGLLPHLTEKSIFIDSLMDHLPELTKAVRAQKTELQELIAKDLRSQETADLTRTLLAPHIQSLKTRTLHPLVFQGSLEHVPVHVLVANGEWLMPDQLLLDFLGEAQRSQSLPIVIAKKIHGILFPLFKSLGIIGTNTYVCHVSESTFLKYEELDRELSTHQVSATPLRVSYNERVENLQELTQDIRHDSYAGNLLKNFLAVTLPEQAEDSYATWSLQPRDFNGSFEDVVKGIDGGKLRTQLLKWIKNRKTLKAKLEKLKSKSTK